MINLKISWQHDFTVLPRVCFSSVSTSTMYKLRIYWKCFLDIFVCLWLSDFMCTHIEEPESWGWIHGSIGTLHRFSMCHSITDVSSQIWLSSLRSILRTMNLLTALGISRLSVWPGLRLRVSGGPKWPENSCVCLDPQLLLCTHVFISVAYLWQQCMYKGHQGRSGRQIKWHRNCLLFLL